MIHTETGEADVLCIGGGLAGLMAGIKASELGAKVVIVDKGNTLRSGSGASGCDHLCCYIPEVHGPDIEPCVEEHYSGPMCVIRDKPPIRAWLERSFEVVKLFDSWGIPTRYRGEYNFGGQAIPGHPRMWLHYEGQNQKRVLTREALKRGAQIINRVMVTDFLVDKDRVVGAIGIGTREDKIVEFRAKSVLVATGWQTRMFPSPLPEYMFGISSPPENTGDGRAMAYRAGAELMNVELVHRWAGPKYLPRTGKATWVGLLRDASGNLLDTTLTRPDKRYGSPVAGRPHIYDEYARTGKGPLYMDCRGISDEDFEYMMHWMGHEGNSALVKYMEEEGIDVRKHMVEFTTYELRSIGGIYYNERAETSRKGLYAAGDEVIGNGCLAATLGLIAGENAAAYSRQVDIDYNAGDAGGLIEQRQVQCDEILSRQAGADWTEVNLALQHIMNDYAGTLRSETLLEAGQGHLARLKERAYRSLMARNQHELTRCLEVLNLLDMCELMFLTAKERKETRRGHFRADYPRANPEMDKLLMVKKIDGKPVLEWREIRR